MSDLYETKVFRLEPQPTGEIAPRRIKTFLSALSTSEALSHLNISSTGSGCSSLLFTPDSQRLIMSLTHLSVAIVALPPSGEEVRVMECFRPLQSDGGRVVKQKKGLEGGSKKRRSEAMEDVDMDEELANGDANGTNGANGVSDEDSDDEEDEGNEDVSEETKVSSTPGAWIACLAASEDGQWLATSDLLGRIAIYNLDTLRVSIAAYRHVRALTCSNTSSSPPCRSPHLQSRSLPLTPLYWRSQHQPVLFNSIILRTADSSRPHLSSLRSTRHSERSSRLSSRSPSNRSEPTPERLASLFGHTTGYAQSS